MGHRIGKIFSNGCIRQAAVRSSVRSGSKVKTSNPSTFIPPAYINQTQQQIAHARNFNTKQSIMSVHTKARCKIYPRETDVVRCPVPDEKVPWSVDFLDYAPVEFTSKTVKSQPVWADPPDPREVKEFNQVDSLHKVNRKTFEDIGEYEVIDGFPRNPRGRTGITGRGCLGRWGPNHAADPIVTRWKRDKNNEKMIGGDGKPTLQFVSVQRRDNGEWALPGGMVDPGENRTATLIREFGEEALNSLEKTDEEKEKIKQMLTELFDKGEKIYKGYVDDPRNTDNAWMETKAINFHDDEGTGVGAFQLHAGDDAQAVQWKDIDSDLVLYASHKDFIRETVRRRNAHWDNSSV